MEPKQAKPSFLKDIFSSNALFTHGSRLVCGTSGLGGVWGKVDEKESVDSILYMLGQGITSLDTAPSYHLAEKIAGQAVRQWKGEIFISTKVGRLPARRADECYVDYSPAAMRDSLNRSLDLLGREKVDLLFLHEPHLVPVEKMPEILETLTSFREEGKTDLLGIGGNPRPAFMPYVSGKYFDVLSGFLGLDACNLHALNTYIPQLNKEGIAFYAASALHMGLLGDKYEFFAKNPPDNEWITRRDIAAATAVRQIAVRENISLPELSLRYLLSAREAGRVVAGAANMEQAKSLVAIWAKGGLEENLFDEISLEILNHNSG